MNETGPELVTSPSISAFHAKCSTSETKTYFLYHFYHWWTSIGPCIPWSACCDYTGASIEVYNLSVYFRYKKVGFLNCICWGHSRHSVEKSLLCRGKDIHVHCCLFSCYVPIFFILEVFLCILCLRLKSKKPWRTSQEELFLILMYEFSFSVNTGASCLLRSTAPSQDALLIYCCSLCIVYYWTSRGVFILFDFQYF